MLTIEDKQRYLKEYLLIKNESYADEIKESIYNYFFEFQEEQNFVFLNKLCTYKDIKDKIEFIISKIILHEDDDSFENLLHEYII